MAAHESLPLILQNIQASRFVSAAGLVILLYDHLLTLDDEIQYIWKARPSMPRTLFLVIRYVVPCGVLIHTYQLSGISNVTLSDTFCKVWFTISIYVGMITIAIGNFLVLLRLWTLWERNRRLMIWTLLLFIMTQVANVVCATIAIAKMMPVLGFQPMLHLCLLTERVDVAILWAPGIVFELMVFVTVCWNALDRPRDGHTAVTKALYRDGFNYFVVLLSLRIANLSLAVAAPLSLVFLGVFFVWCTTTVTVTRLILNLRNISSNEYQNIVFSRGPYNR